MKKLYGVDDTKNFYKFLGRGNMSLSLDPTNHSALQYNESVADAIAALCEPLFSNFSITTFAYSHFFNNGAYLDLCSNLAWQRHNMEHFASHPFITNYIKDIRQNGIRYTLWNNDPGEPREEIFTRFIIDSCNFDLWHGFTLYKHYEDSLEAWHFATTKENYKVTNFYLNHLDLLDHFIFYFREKASLLIDPSDISKLVVFKDPSSVINVDSASALEKDIKEYIQQTNLKKYCFKTSHGIVRLSRREVECVSHLASNKTIKEIARVISLSPRTVESYLKNAETKLGCWKRSQLVDIISKYVEKPVLGLF